MKLDPAERRRLRARRLNPIVPVCASVSRKSVSPTPHVASLYRDMVGQDIPCEVMPEAILRKTCRLVVAGSPAEHTPRPMPQRVSTQGDAFFLDEVEQTLGHARNAWACFFFHAAGGVHVPSCSCGEPLNLRKTARCVSGGAGRLREGTCKHVLSTPNLPAHCGCRRVGKDF